MTKTRQIIITLTNYPYLLNNHISDMSDIKMRHMAFFDLSVNKILLRNVHPGCIRVPRGVAGPPGSAKDGRFCVGRR